MARIPTKYESALAYLVGRKFALPSWEEATSESGPLAGEPDPQMLEEADAYRLELAELPPEELLRRADEERARQLERIEAEAEYNQPSAMADVEHWSRAAYWTLSEAVWLSLGRDPRRVSGLSFGFNKSSPLLVEFLNRSDLVDRAKRFGQLFDPAFPGLFLAWAKRNRIEYPNELEEAVVAHGQQVGDWKTLYDKATAAYDKATAAHESQIADLQALYEKAAADHKKQNANWKARCDEALAALRNARDQLAEFSATIEDLRGQLTKAESATAEAEAERDRLRQELGEQLETRPKETLLKMLIGMAIGGYGHDPRAARTKTAADIADDLARLGIPVTDDTIRKWLAEATDLLPPRETE